MGRTFLLLTTALTATSAQAQDGYDLGALILQSALRDDRPLLEIPVAASRVGREEIEAKQAGDFATVLTGVPGLIITGGPRGIAQEPNIRGFSDEQLVYKLDGGRQNFGLAHKGRFFLDPDMVQSVEVVRGGGSTLHGSARLAACSRSRPAMRRICWTRATTSAVR